MLAVQHGSTTRALLILLLALPLLAKADDHSDPTSPLGWQSVSVSDILPDAALDSITLPERPLRLANRPSPTPSRLDWLPGLSDVASLLALESAPITVQEHATPDAPEKIPEAAPIKQPSPSQQGPSLVPAQSDPKTLSIPSESAKPLEPDAVVSDSPPRDLPATSEPSQKTKLAKPLKTSPLKTSKVQPKAKKAPAAKPATPPKPLTRNMQYLRTRLRTVLSFYYRQPMNSVEHDPWEVMHSMLSYELHSRVLEGGPNGKPITAVGHLCFNRPTERKQMLYLTDDGGIDARVGVGLQGHKGQFLAMLAQCNVSPDYPIRVEDKKFTLHDLIRSEQRTCYTRTELTFKLIGLGHYLASNATWVNDQGESWDIPRLIQEERTQPIRGAACGGTHRLSGLSLAFRRREARGEPIDGEYQEAAKFVAQHQKYAFQLQNSDGSLSTEWFRGRGDDEDIERRLRTTGHLLEWLLYSLPDEQLTSRGTIRAVTYLTNLLSRYGKQDWHKGSLAHALHALVIYDKRVFQTHDKTLPEGLAVNPASTRYRGYAMRRGVMRYDEAPGESRGFFGLFGSTRSTSRPSRQHAR